MCISYDIISHYLPFNKSLGSTSSMSAILSSVCNDGWVVLLHHFESVTGETPSSCANHFAVLFFSTKTSFNLFKSLLSMINQLNFRAKLFPFFEINERKTEKLNLWRWNLTFHAQFATWIYDSFTQLSALQLREMEQYEKRGRNRKAVKFLIVYEYNTEL